MKLEILILALEDAHRRQTTEVRAISLFPRWLVELRCTDSVHGKQTSPLRQTCITRRDKQTYIIDGSI